MKIFLFRLSRVLSVITVLLLLYFFNMIYDGFDNRENWKWYGIFSIIIFSYLIFVPILTYNWMSFGKFTFWIKSPNKENE